MSQVFPTDNDNEKWAVKISTGKRLMRSTHSEPPTRKLSIQKTTPKKKQSAEKWKENLSKFVAESQKQCDKDARSAIEILEKWRMDTCARFDVILQHISEACHEVTLPSLSPIPTIPLALPPQSSSVLSSSPSATREIGDLHVASISPVPTKTINSQNTVAKTVVNNPTEKSTPRTGKADNSSKRSTRQLTEPVKSVPVKSVPVKSMPILAEETDAEDSLNAFLNHPIDETRFEKMAGKKIDRRQNVFHRSPMKNDKFDASIRKKPMAFHSSVLAMSTNLPRVVLDMPNEQLKVASDKNSQSTATTNNSKPLATTVNKDKSVANKGINSNGMKIKSSSHSMDAEKSAIYQKFLETKRRIDEREAKKAQQQAAGLVAIIDKNSDQANPPIQM